MQKITTFLWFDDQAEEAANFYVSLFKNSKVLSTHHKDGKVLTVSFEILGQNFMALNGGPMFKFTEAISLYVECENQAEVDGLWNKLTSGGGSEIQCGWLKDKYGLTSQIIPKVLLQYLTDANPKKSQAAFEAMMKMKKINILDLQKAYEEAVA